MVRQDSEEGDAAEAVEGADVAELGNRMPVPTGALPSLGLPSVGLRARRWSAARPGLRARRWLGIRSKRLVPAFCIDLTFRSANALFGRAFRDAPKQEGGDGHDNADGTRGTSSLCWEEPGVWL